MAHPVDSENWTELTRAFSSFFSGYGTVSITEEFASFEANTNLVETSFTLFKDGRFASGMPLHSLQSKAGTVKFDAERTSIKCTGAFGEYEYIVPEILKQR